MRSDITYLELIAKKVSGELTSEEEKIVTVWLNSDPANKLLLKEFEQLWKMSGSLKNDFDPDIEKAWIKLKTEFDNPGKVKQKNRRLSLWLKIAATIIIAIAISFFIKNITKKELQIPLATNLIAKDSIAEVITKDSIKIFYLPDSTRITLSKNSRFTYPKKFTDSVRSVILNGEAFFEVAPDSTHPFIIHTGEMETRVVGTSFNIRDYENESGIKVDVVTGKVNVKIKTKQGLKSAMIEPGDELDYNKTDAAITETKSKNTDYTKWKGLKFKKMIRKNIHAIQQKFKKEKQK